MKYTTLIDNDFIFLTKEDGYVQRAVEQFDSFEKDLFFHFENVLSLGEDIATDVLKTGLRYFDSSNMSNIYIGRWVVWHFPRQWILEHIQSVAQETLNLEDEWNFRRLMEVYIEIEHRKGLQELRKIGMASEDPDLRDTAEEI